jgi:hypothetical protein
MVAKGTALERTNAWLTLTGTITVPHFGLADVSPHTAATLAFCAISMLHAKTIND